MPLLPRSVEDGKDRFCMGGGGCFGTPLEYCSASPRAYPYLSCEVAYTDGLSGIIATILNDGTSPHTGAKLLKPETVKGKADAMSITSGQR